MIECRAVGSEVHLLGSIDEHTTLEDAFTKLSKAPGDPLRLNLQGILRINSIGVRHWIPFMTRLCRERKVAVTAMSYPLVMQANMLANMMGGARLLSCMAPYFCSDCETNRMVLVAAEDVKKDGAAPARGCPECGSPMEFDELDNYFAFFARSP